MYIYVWDPKDPRTQIMGRWGQILSSEWYLRPWTLRGIKSILATYVVGVGNLMYRDYIRDYTKLQGGIYISYGAATVNFSLVKGPLTVDIGAIMVS